MSDFNNLAEITAFCGYIFIALGMFLLNRGDLRGWLAHCVGCTIWFANGFVLNNINIVLWNVLFIIINIAGWLNWKKKGISS